MVENPAKAQKRGATSLNRTLNLSVSILPICGWTTVNGQQTIQAAFLVSLSSAALAIERLTLQLRSL